MSTIKTNTAIDAAVRLGTLIESHGRDAGRQLGDYLRPWLREDEVLPDFTLALQLPARMIEHTGQRLREIEKELDELRNREGEAQISRDHAASALRWKLVETRRLLTAVFGPRRTATVLGIDGRTAPANHYSPLGSQAADFLKVLRDPKRLAMPRPACFDPASAAAAFEPLVVAFREAGDHLDGARRESAARLETRDQARSELDRGIHCAVSILGGWLGLIRRADLVEKLHLLLRPDKTRKARA